MRELIACLDEVAANREVRAVVLGAAGSVFSSGHDLGEMVAQDLNRYREIFDVCTVLMTRVQEIPQPVIAQVQGVATAAGCQLVAACDLAVASENASFATPGVRIGLFCTTPMVAVSRAVGRKRALEILDRSDKAPISWEDYTYYIRCITRGTAAIPIALTPCSKRSR